MTPLFKKLNLKDQKLIHVLNSPSSFQQELDDISTSIKVSRSISSTAEFVMIFVTKKEQIGSTIKEIESNLDEDAVLWYCYPKKSSKKYSTDISRDSGWEEMGKLEYEGVRMVAIDEDWSALRFRKVDNIKTMKRNFALSEKAKERISKKKKG